MEKIKINRIVKALVGMGAENQETLTYQVGGLFRDSRIIADIKHIGPASIALYGKTISDCAETNISYELGRIGTVTGITLLLEHEQIEIDDVFNTKTVESNE